MFFSGQLRIAAQYRAGGGAALWREPPDRSHPARFDGGPVVIKALPATDGGPVITALLADGGPVVITALLASAPFETGREAGRARCPGAHLPRGARCGFAIRPCS